MLNAFRHQVVAKGSCPGDIAGGEALCVCVCVHPAECSSVCAVEEKSSFNWRDTEKTEVSHVFPLFTKHFHIHPHILMFTATLWGGSIITSLLYQGEMKVPERQRSNPKMTASR